MNRFDLQRLANTRLREAKALLAAGEYSGAYYLTGYAVECGLKACFAKSVKRYDFPDKARAGKVFVHKLQDLVKIADFSEDLTAAKEASTNFETGWILVCNWTEESRYSLWTRYEAEAILDAVGRRKGGVLPWIKRHW